MRRGMLLTLGVALLTFAGCGGEEVDTEGEMTMDSTMMQAPGDTMMGMQGMAGTPQDADHEFLRTMIDHHEGLVAISGVAMEGAADDSVKSAARHLNTRQAAGQDSMGAMIQRMYGEQHEATIMPKNAAQADSLRQMSGADADRYFLRTTIAHHEEGIRMIDRFMPRFTKPEVRQMAERMRTEQEREIQELRGRLESMG